MTDVLFSSRLKKIREISGLNQEQFAKEIGVSRPTLSLYEKGTRTPDIDVLRNIHIKTSASVYYLLGLSDTIYDSSQIDGDKELVQRETGLTDKSLAALAPDKFAARRIVNLLLSREERYFLIAQRYHAATARPDWPECSVVFEPHFIQETLEVFRFHDGDDISETASIEANLMVRLSKLSEKDLRSAREKIEEIAGEDEENAP